YALTREAKGAAPLPADSHYPLEGLRLPEGIAKQLEPPTIEGKPLTAFVDQRDKVLEVLVSAAKNEVLGKQVRVSVIDLLAEQRHARMLACLNKSLAVVSGISARLTSPSGVLIPGQATPFEFAITNGGNNQVRVSMVASGSAGDKDYIMLSTNHAVNSAIPPGGAIKIPTTYKMPDNAQLTVPHSEHLY